jgi:hypothetical protein
MATNAPPTSSSSASPVSALRSAIARSLPSSPARNSCGTNGVLNSMFGRSPARSRMILEARYSSRRWIEVSLSAYLEMKIESSIAESPPPITATFSPLKKAPSQTPHVETPLPDSSSSPGIPSRRGSAPIARISALPACSSSPRNTRWSSPSDSSTRSASSVMKRVPNRSAWARNWFIISGPMIPSG